MKDFVIQPSKTVKYVIIVLIIVAIIALAYQFYKASQAAGKALGDKLGTKIIADQTGVSEARQLICKQIADDCRKGVWQDAFTNKIWWVEDDLIVVALNRCVSSSEAILVCQLYRESYGDSLKTIVEGGYFVERNRVRITYRNSLV